MELDIRKENNEIERIRFAEKFTESEEANTIMGDRYDPFICITDFRCCDAKIAKADIDNLIKALEKAKQIWGNK